MASNADLIIGGFGSDDAKGLAGAYESESAASPLEQWVAGRVASGMSPEEVAVEHKLAEAGHIPHPSDHPNAPQPPPSGLSGPAGQQNQDAMQYALRRGQPPGALQQGPGLAPPPGSPPPPPDASSAPAAPPDAASPPPTASRGGGFPGIKTKGDYRTLMGAAPVLAGKHRSLQDEATLIKLRADQKRETDAAKSELDKGIKEMTIGSREKIALMRMAQSGDEFQQTQAQKFIGMRQQWDMQTRALDADVKKVNSARGSSERIALLRIMASDAAHAEQQVGRDATSFNMLAENDPVRLDAEKMAKEAAQRRKDYTEQLNIQLRHAQSENEGTPLPEPGAPAAPAPTEPAKPQLMKHEIKHYGNAPSPAAPLNPGLEKARAWATAHPEDLRSAAILQKIQSMGTH